MPKFDFGKHPDKQGFNNPRWLRDNGLMQQAKNLQSLMIELGPTFVDMGLMTP